MDEFNCTHTVGQQLYAYPSLTGIHEYLQQNHLGLNLAFCLVLLFTAEIHKVNRVKSFQFQLFF